MESAADRLRQFLTPMPPADPAENLRQALDLADCGLSMMEMNLRRQFPTAAEAEIDQRLSDWLQQRPTDCDERR